MKTIAIIALVLAIISLTLCGINVLMTIGIAKSTIEIEQRQKEKEDIRIHVDGNRKRKINLKTAKKLEEKVSLARVPSIVRKSKRIREFASSVRRSFQDSQRFHDMRSYMSRKKVTVILLAVLILCVPVFSILGMLMEPMSILTR